MSAHVCHARGCNTAVPPARLMCEPHWRNVPYELRKAVLDNYRPGQERDRHPTRAWVEAARAAVRSLEGK